VLPSPADVGVFEEFEYDLMRELDTNVSQAGVRTEQAPRARIAAAVGAVAPAGNDGARRSSALDARRIAAADEDAICLLFGCYRTEHFAALKLKHA